MTSHLRLQASFEPFTANATYQTAPTLPPVKKQKMSLTQTYYIASTARTKLGREAGRADHDLRLLVGHANLLDSLMVELADAEREQEAWFNQSVNKASTPEEPRHVQWIDTIAEEDDDDDDDDDMESDDGSDIYDEDADMFNIPLKKIRSPPVEISSEEIDDEADSDDEFDDEHALIRVPSQHSPPELTLDSESDSEDESIPSPEQPPFELSEKERQAITTTDFYSKPQSIENLLAQQHQQPMIAAC
ncbi:uncharacterized protein MYCFIDRAFT_212762 [Pseudocercospora fijiensis CIRAD86]|uniref:Uncharacterized protein n=1 Tax=Pseudocercospora fijiensis (strain CIRAD86) TaxID=383855 RepID=M3AHI0_PSEFD|nr:uncharacterized protein MYCFIDRAFT_212762 [Pseudocercospora fijiensis CIRAD86]EME76967.1 hypothetical protein MYCFIDRAFT_212762 [Pseudocercospora fijiensis CIRAD86]